MTCITNYYRILLLNIKRICIRSLLLHENHAAPVPQTVLTILAIMTVARYNENDHHKSTTEQITRILPSRRMVTANLVLVQL